MIYAMLDCKGSGERPTLFAAPTEPALLRELFGFIYSWLDSDGETDLPEEWVQANPPDGVDISSPAAVRAWLEAFSQEASDPSYWTFHEPQIVYCAE